VFERKGLFHQQATESACDVFLSQAHQESEGDGLLRDLLAGCHLLEDCHSLLLLTATGQGGSCSRRLTVQTLPRADDYTREKMQQATREMLRHRERWERQDLWASGRLESLAWMLKNRMSEGRHLTELCRYQDAVQCFKSILRVQEPKRLIAEVDNPDKDLKIFDQARMDALDWLPYVGLLMDRKDIVIEYGKKWVEARRQWLENPRRPRDKKKPTDQRAAPIGQKPTCDQYVGLENCAAKILRWYVMMGGVGGRAELMQMRQEFLRKGGYYDPEFDPLRYVYRK
jgi:hypothetical protein